MSGKSLKQKTEQALIKKVEMPFRSLLYQKVLVRPAISVAGLIMAGDPTDEVIGSGYVYYAMGKDQSLIQQLITLNKIDNITEQLAPANYILEFASPMMLAVLAKTIQ